MPAALPIGTVRVWNGRTVVKCSHHGANWERWKEETAGTTLKDIRNQPEHENKRQERSRKSVRKSNRERARIRDRRRLRFDAYYPVVHGPVTTQIQFDAHANYQDVTVAGLVVMMPFRLKRDAVEWAREKYPAAKVIHSWDLTGPEFEGYRREVPDDR